jgi:hypothetical protein
MEILNNPESEIFQQTIEKQKKFIKIRLSKIRSNRYLNDTMGCIDTKEVIVKHLNLGPAQNLIQTFFNYKTLECSYCNRKKGENNIRQFERAHCHNYSRGDILLKAVDELYVDDKTPLPAGKILRRFIEMHEFCPIYMLCNICHNKYDKLQRQKKKKYY